MTPRFKAWLDSKGARPVAQEVLDGYAKAMHDIMPEIRRNIRRQAIAAAKVRAEGTPLFPRRQA